MSTSRHCTWQGFSPPCWHSRSDHELEVEKKLIIVDYKYFQCLSHSTKFDIWLMWRHYLAVVFVSHKLHVVSCQHACTCVHIFMSLNCIAWETILECKVCSILGSERDKYSIFMHCLATFEESNIHWGRMTPTLHTLKHRGRGLKLVQSVANVQLFSKLHPQSVN